MSEYYAQSVSREDMRQIAYLVRKKFGYLNHWKLPVDRLLDQMCDAFPELSYEIVPDNEWDDPTAHAITSISSTKILMKLLFTLVLTMIHKEAIMNLTDKLIQFDKTEDTSIFNTTNKYTIPECWGVCVSLFEWLKLEHKRYLWKLEGRPTTSKTLTLHPEAEFTRLIPDFIESDDVFRHSLKITENQLYFSDEITEDEIRTITKSAFDYYNPGRSYN